MEIKSHRLKTLYKYILTYAVTLIIPLIAFLYHINKNVIPLFEQQAIDTVRENLLKGEERTEQKFKQMNKIVVSIGDNLALSPYTIRENHYKMHSAMEELRKYRSADDFYYDIAYYIKGNDYIYSSFHFTDVRTFINSFYNFENWDYDEFYNNINTIDSPVLRPADRTRGLFFTKEELIVYMLSVRQYGPHAVVIFLIQNSKMKELHEGILEEYNENVYMLNSEGELVTSLNENSVHEEYIKQHLSASSDKNSTGYSSTLMDGYIISSVKTDDGKLQLVSVVNRDRIMEKVESIKIRVYIVFSLVFFAGVVIIIIALYINYTPLHRLYKKITGNLQTGLAAKDEMATVNMAFDHMVTIIDRLSSSVEKYKNNLRNYVLRELVNGDSFQGERLAHIDFLSPEPRDYTIVVVKHPNPGDESDRAELMQTAYEIFRKIIRENNMDFYSIDNIEEDQLILILYYAEGSVKDEFIKELLEEIYAVVLEVIKIRLIIGVGNRYNDILSIGQSFSEASKAVQYNSHYRNSGVVLFKEIEPLEGSTKPFHYPYGELTKLSAQLKSGSLDSAGETLSKLTIELLKEDIPEFITRCIIFDIFNMLIKTSIDMNINMGDVLHNYLKSITSGGKQNMSSLLSMLDVVYREFCVQVIKNEPCDNPLLDKIMSYIQSNYSEYGFSLEAMASYLGITVPYLSQYFKNNTGETLTEYIWKLRLKTAKYMLENTELSVNEIVKSVGYVDTSSFCRRFKKEEGITPGEYIRKYRNKQNTQITSGLPTSQGHSLSFH
jgi:two-component system response regulator YesN